MLLFDWSTVSFSKDRLTLQLIFENPEMVSVDLVNGPDLLQIKVVDPLYFRSKNYVTVKNETTVVTKLPR